MNDQNVPIATYRLQFSRVFTFDDAKELVPYLSRLGITHIYSSPILRSRVASTHGYDVVDPITVNPNIGDETTFRGLVTTAQAHGLGLILDIVPNHMAASSTENLYWRDVLMFGVSSSYCRWFDVDWRMPDAESWGRVLIPILGAPLSKILASDELSVVWEDGRFCIRYYEHLFPLDPSTVPTVCRFGAASLSETLPPEHPTRQTIDELLTKLARIPGRIVRTRRDTELPLDEIELWLSQLAGRIEASPLTHNWAETTARQFGEGDEGRKRIRKLLNRQCYRLAFWRLAARAINYRRFFDINDLVSIRQEDPYVFDETHALVARWINDGLLSGLRVDHIDGLRNPRGYLQRLAELAGSQTALRPFRLFVEKILAPDERLPDDWPVDGTTGYEFLNDVESLFVSPEGFEEIVDGYQRTLGQPVRWYKIERQAKRRVLKDELSSFVGRLADLLLRITRRDEKTNALTEQQLVRAIVEVVVGLPVYRTYVDDRTAEISAADRRWIETALTRARLSERADSEAVAFLGSVLLLDGLPDLPDHEQRERLNFIQRFQQITGPAAAKGVEDTALYSYVPLVSLNEVGGEPQRDLANAVTRFHQTNKQRAATSPQSMLCATTHDTKRSADVRSRLDVLSEMPKLWNGYVSRWMRMNQPLRQTVKGKPAPDPATEYLFYQSLVALWPAVAQTGTESSFPDAAALAALADRLNQYMLKAAREAKTRTNWIDSNKVYETALSEFVRNAILCGVRATIASPFLADVQSLVSRITRCGFWNALSRLVLQYTSPGTPDLYQGDELWNFSLVDPDNRRAVNFEQRRELLDDLVIRFETADQRDALLTELVAAPEDGRIKMHVLRTLLHARNQHPDLFFSGDYQPLEASGPASTHLVSFARTAAGAAIVVIVPRLLCSLIATPTQPPGGRDVWNRTTVPLPENLRQREWHSPLTGETHNDFGNRIDVATALRQLPTAVLIAE
ncbi:malto-oligosyltrehalose synthase [bacterium]|nr:malto-oligosyltrehalose synthase [bacterium]